MGIPVQTRWEPELDLYNRESAWWASLSVEQQAAARWVTEALPQWMIDSLDAHDLPVVDAELAGHSPVKLMSTNLREFLDQVA